ncbi:MAG: hypothetical protein VXZ40_04250 [Nanoarchaeota archaeon]|nr:hypothetical protein [Nanoarchaeota archaeon]
MDKKKRLLITLGTLTIFYLLIIISFYFSYSKSLNEYNNDVYEGFNTLQNIIHKVHEEDSKLYKSFMSQDFLSSQSNREQYLSKVNHSSNVVSDLLGLKQNNLFSSETLADTIDEYYSLENLRERIIELKKLNEISNNKEYNSEISELVSQYEEQIGILLLDINLEIELNRQKNLDFINKLKKDYIIKQFISSLIFIIYLLIMIYLLEGHKEFIPQNKKFKKEDKLILDSDMQKIVSFIKKEVAQGNFPTIKELKAHIKISHPTLIIKLNELQKENVISIKKKGRNKHLFLN